MRRCLPWLLLLGCSSSRTTQLDANVASDFAGERASGGAPSIAITSPSGGAVVPTNGAVNVYFTVDGFRLEVPGRCRSLAACGHVHLLVDGADCNLPTSPYNASGSASPITANLGLCPRIHTQHLIRAELHDDTHYPVVGSDGMTVSDSVTITATFAGFDLGWLNDASLPANDFGGSDLGATDGGRGDLPSPVDGGGSDR